MACRWIMHTEAAVATAGGTRYSPHNPYPHPQRHPQLSSWLQCFRGQVWNLTQTAPSRQFGKTRALGCFWSLSPSERSNGSCTQPSSLTLPSSSDPAPWTRQKRMTKPATRPLKFRLNRKYPTSPRCVERKGVDIVHIPCYRFRTRTAKHHDKSDSHIPWKWSGLINLVMDFLIAFH